MSKTLKIKLPKTLEALPVKQPRNDMRLYSFDTDSVFEFELENEAGVESIQLVLTDGTTFKNIYDVEKTEDKFSWKIDESILGFVGIVNVEVNVRTTVGTNTVFQSAFELEKSLIDDGVFEAKQFYVERIENILNDIQNTDWTGPKGEQGEKGIKGDTGPQGPKGDPGKNGKDGIDGKDAVDKARGMSFEAFNSYNILLCNIPDELYSAEYIRSHTKIYPMINAGTGYSLDMQEAYKADNPIYNIVRLVNTDFIVDNNKGDAKTYLIRFEDVEKDIRVDKVLVVGKKNIFD